MCKCFPAIFGQKLLARNYGKYIKFLAKEVTGSWERVGGGTVRDAEQTKWQVIMLIGFAFWGRNIIRERPSQSKLRERRENSN